MKRKQNKPSPVEHFQLKKININSSIIKKHMPLLQFSDTQRYVLNATN